LIQAFDVFEIVAIGRKTWGKIPMSIIHKTFQTKADERCPGIPGLRITGDKGGVQINPDYDAEPNSYSIKRVFRNGQ
jgi:hypothetical protein